MTNPIQKELLTVREVAQTMGLGISTIWRHVASGSFPAPIKICGSTRWRRSDLEQLIGSEQDKAA